MRHITSQEKNLIREKLLYGSGGKKTWGDVIEDQMRAEEVRNEAKKQNLSILWKHKN